MASYVSQSSFKLAPQQKIEDNSKFNEKIAIEVALKILFQEGKIIAEESLTLDNLLEAERVLCAPDSSYHVLTDAAIFTKFPNYKDFIKGITTQGDPIYIVSETARHALHLTIDNRIQNLPPAERMTPLGISMKNLGNYLDRLKEITNAPSENVQDEIFEPQQAGQTRALKDFQACVLL